jgi:hypothetical protein
MPDHYQPVMDNRDLYRVLEHPGFLEISRWPELDEPWAIGIRLNASHTDPLITWFRGQTMSSVLTQAVCGIERLGAH